MLTLETRKLVNPFSHRTVALWGLSRGITLRALKAASASLLVSRLADVSVPGGCRGRLALHQVCRPKKSKIRRIPPNGARPRQHMVAHGSLCLQEIYNCWPHMCNTYEKTRKIIECSTAGDPRDYRPLPPCAPVCHPSCLLSNFRDLQGGRCGM